MKKGLQDYLFGSNTKDFTEQNLPPDRKRLFFYLVRTRSVRVIKTNLWATLFLLPYLIWFVLCSVYAQRFGDLSDAQNFSDYMGFVLAYKIPVSFLCGLLASCGFAGAFCQVRKIVWGIPMPVTRGFFRGIKSSWKEFLLLGAFCGVFSALFELAFLFVAYQSGTVFEKYLYFGLLIFSAVVVASAVMFAATQSCTYKMRLFAPLKNGFVLTIKYFGKCLGILAISVVPVCVWFVIPSIISVLAGCVVAAAVGVSYVALLWILFCDYVFDKHINKTQYPDFYRKGLAPQTCAEGEKHG